MQVHDVAGIVDLADEAVAVLLGRLDPRAHVGNEVPAAVGDDAFRRGESVDPTSAGEPAFAIVIGAAVNTADSGPGDREAAVTGGMTVWT